MPWLVKAGIMPLTASRSDSSATWIHALRPMRLRISSRVVLLDSSLYSLLGIHSDTSHHIPGSIQYQRRPRLGRWPLLDQSPECHPLPPRFSRSARKATRYLPLSDVYRSGKYGGMGAGWEIQKAGTVPIRRFQLPISRHRQLTWTMTKLSAGDSLFWR